MTALATPASQPEKSAEGAASGVEVLRSVWTLMPILAVLNLAAASVLFAGSAFTGSTSWVSVSLYPVPLLWLLIVLDHVRVEKEGGRVVGVRAAWSTALRSVKPALVLGVPASLIMLSALTAGHLWLTTRTVIMLLPLVVGAVAFSFFAFAACSVVRAMHDETPLRSLRSGWGEALGAPSRNLAAATCLLAIPTLVTVLNPGVLLAIPAPFALCALLASRGAGPAVAE